MFRGCVDGVSYYSYEAFRKAVEEYKRRKEERDTDCMSS